MGKVTPQEQGKKFLKPGKVVLVLQGKFAGRKAVIIRAADGNKTRKYGHCILAGISKYPQRVTRKTTARKAAMKSRVKPFIKTYNWNHIMPTRYALDIDFRSFINGSVVADPTKKKVALKKAKTLMINDYLTGKNRWFYNKLKF
eukprot:NODE_6246_length_521_cov_113.169492_g5478_i1.p1 GENE.NODE_6246_length_521_cov_113.169492_g5478_i1~~NODE_6246_length_521_cov_113.169492_g5478_i1.p1  ORF type:complete len:161 (+),score=4.64 NODE_6246_length_521_cov_113.169492_g5478_i1:54-485(+)